MKGIEAHRLRKLPFRRNPTFSDKNAVFDNNANLVCYLRCKVIRRQFPGQIPCVNVMGKGGIPGVNVHSVEMWASFLSGASLVYGLNGRGE